MIVTGASRGIGAAIARLAAHRGYAVAVNFSSADNEAKQIATEINAAGGCALATHADVSQEDQIVGLSNSSTPPRAS